MCSAHASQNAQTSGGGDERHSGHPRGETSYTYDKVELSEATAQAV